MERVDLPSSDFVIARAIGFRGFGGRRAGEIMFIDSAGVSSGSLFGGAADAEIKRRCNHMSASGESFDFMAVKVGDRDAVAAGLACGGEADILLNRSSALPPEFIKRLASREPTALATVVSGRHKGAVLAVSSDRIARVSGTEITEERSLDILKQELLRFYTRGLPAFVVEEVEDATVSFEMFSPPTHMVIVGSSNLAQALVDQGELLGWSATVTDDTDEGCLEVSGLGGNDALIILTHDHGIGIPIVSELLKRAPHIYIGALGSRHTQQTRSALLSELGFSDKEIGRICGPVGLDLGSKTPEDTALAICAEILAHVSGRDAKPLKYSSGSING
ncbi:MAG: XdhC family protein [Actinomycetota bacterium]|nr:XdhC family protein [Actinomycetota bacterium]